MSFTVSQNIFKDDATVFTVVKCDDGAVSMKHLQPLLDATDTVLGVSAIYGKHCQLSLIAFSTLSRALVVTIPARHVPRPQNPEKRQLVAKSRSLIQDHLLVNPVFQKYAFEMDQLAVALHLDLSIHINHGVDMLSVARTDYRHSLQGLMSALGGEETLHKQNVKSLLFSTPKTSTVDAATRVALRAWAACRTAGLPHMSSRFVSLPRIDTTAFSKPHLVAIATISRHAALLDAMKPTYVKNDVANQFSVKKDVVNLVCARFPTRIRQSKNQSVRIEVVGKGASSQVTGKACKVNGRSAQINVNGPIRGDRILSVTTFGKDDPTCAESARLDTILQTLQHRTEILSNPFFLALWFPKEELEWPKPKEQKRAIPVDTSRNLNDSQCMAVRKILSDKNEDRIILVQGPPGTGKTTVIAASVMSHHSAKSGRHIWVAAQSNVAVKNIAEKFMKEGFDHFRLLVSKDFHFDWHEHLYEKVQRCLIRADSLIGLSIIEASRLLLDCKVILCTLSMFSNPLIGVLLRIVPVEVVILDEASQIECGDYLPIFHQFRATLSKLVLIGDDKQLPPYGQEDIPDLRSVFEFSHLRKKALFLTTQYRMPHLIGNFISRNVYGGKLLTVHDSKTSKSCCFIDVDKGQEDKLGRGHSFFNRQEARVVVKLARLYESMKMSFRIITPYDAQRSYIESLLESERLKWENKVFNVDSFQGNEDDHIIVSVVRSEKLGFLRNERRTNVMLTRCKQSMIICSSRSFLLGEASDTLMGKLALSLDDGNWINANDILNNRVRLFARPTHT